MNRRNLVILGAALIAVVAIIIIIPRKPVVKPPLNVKPQVLDGNTKLNRAVNAGDIKKVHAELNAGADVNTGGVAGPTPLFNAALKGNLEMVNLLLSKGADVNASTPSGTALSIACATGNIEIVKTLLKAGGDVKAKGGLALCNAAIAKRPDIVRLLLANGADPNATLPTNKKTPLQLACGVADNEEVVQILQRAGAK